MSPSSNLANTAQATAIPPAAKTDAERAAQYDVHRKAAQDQPSHATVDENFKFEYDPNELGDDLGHKTAGSDHGRHNRRILASLSMEGKVVVITGAARGLGNMFARTFIESGSNKVAILDLDKDDSERAAQDIIEWSVEHLECKKGEVECIGLGVNVAKEQAVKDAMDAIVKKWGRIDVLVTAAGIVENFSCLDYPTDRMNLLWDVNVNGTYFCAREAAKHMISSDNTKPGGAIVMVGSMSSSIVNVPQAQAPYNASKAAVRHLASSMAVELATKGVRVNCLSPGYMLTSLTKTILDKDTALRDTWVSLTPQGRMGEPEDLKGAIIYLSSDAAAFTTGVNLNVDGGYTLV